MTHETAVEMLPMQAQCPEMRPLYLQALVLVERLHRLVLGVIKDEFDRSGMDDLSSVQALLLFNIGGGEMRVSELRTRGYYLGSNVTHNLNKLAGLGYINQKRVSGDRRVTLISLTGKGHRIAASVEAIYDRHVNRIEKVDNGLATKDFQHIHDCLRRLDRFLSDRVLYQL